MSEASVYEAGTAKRFRLASAVIARRYLVAAARHAEEGEHEQFRRITSSSSAVHLLHTTLPGWTLLAALVFAPWFWGCTWPLGIQLLNILLLAASGAWAAGMLLRARPSRLPAALLIAVSGLLVQGWVMALNGRTIWDENTGLFSPIPGHLGWLPGSMDQTRSRIDMVQLSGLLGAGLVTAWLGRHRVWRRRILWTVAATAFSIALLGCGQRLTHATDIFWNQSRHLDFFFATFRNVTNAGEYLNFALPVAASLALASALKKRSGHFALSMVAAVIILAGILASGSKIAPLVAGANVACFVALHRDRLRAHFGRGNRLTGLVTLLIFALALGSIVHGVGLDVARDRWGRLFADHDGIATFSHRLLVDQVCGLAALDSGLTGFGAGTFRAVFPYYSNLVAGDLTGVWTYAHNDYAQTFLEWGLIGSALWSLYFLGGMAALARVIWSRSKGTEERIYAAGLIQALLAIGFMALVDFPLQIASIQLVVSVGIGLGWSARAIIQTES